MLPLEPCCPLRNDYAELDWRVQLLVLEYIKANGHALQIAFHLFIAIFVGPWMFTNIPSSGTLSTRGLPANPSDLNTGPPKFLALRCLVLFKITADLVFYGLEQMERSEKYSTAIIRHLGIVQNHLHSKE